jgi:hypothetical protein
VGQLEGVSALQVAERLLELEQIGDLRYHSVPVEVDAVDITSCSGHRDTFYRYYLIRPAAAFVETLPTDHRREALEWHSEVLILPRARGEGMMTRLAPFEAEFAVRSFLRRVEHEIDCALAGQRAGGNGHTQ